MKFISKAQLGILFLVLTACTQFGSIPEQPPEAVAGVLDVQDWDFANDGAVELSGEWGFYWEELLEPEQIAVAYQTAFVPVPDIWINYEVEGIDFIPEGYATYTLTVIMPDTDETYGLFVEGQGSAYTLWVDDDLIAQNGIVGVDYESMTPEKKPISVFFHPNGETVEMVMQVSNYHHRKGGFRNGLMLDLAHPTHQFQMQNWFVEAFSAGILFIMGLYHIFIYASRTKHKAPLYFALLCWALAARVGLTNQNSLLFLFPFIDWFTAFRIEYLTFFLGAPLFGLFLRSLYPGETPRWFVQAQLGFGLAFTLIMLFASTLTASYLPTYYQVVVLAEIGYGMIIFWRIVARRREGSIYMVTASLVWIVAIVIEILYFQNLLPFGKVSPYGFLAFIFVQAILLAARFSKSFQRVESLSGELEELNVDLLESEKKYRGLFEESKDVIFIAGLNTKIRDVNAACEEVLGYTKEELKQKRAHEMLVTPALLNRFISDLFKEGSLKDLEVEVRRKDGRKIDALVTISLHRDEDSNKIIGIHGTLRDVTARKQAEAERLRALKLEQFANTDPLTKIYNRRFFYEAAEKEIKRAKRGKTPLSVVIFDIDHFKKVNDVHGHITGDEVLVRLADLCQRNIRSMDLFARFGGEEFVILMPDTDGLLAREAGEKLRRLVADKSMAAAGDTDVKVTISIGISAWNVDEPLKIETLLDQADKALYRAKEMGRNQVAVWNEDERM